MEPDLLRVVGVLLGCAALLNTGARLVWALLGSAVVFALVAGDPADVWLAALRFADAARSPDWQLVVLLCWLAALLDAAGAGKLTRLFPGAVVLALLAHGLALPWLDLLLACALPLLAVELLRAGWAWFRAPGAARDFAPRLAPTLALGAGLALLLSGRAAAQEVGAIAALGIVGLACHGGQLDASALRRSAAHALRASGAVAALWLAALCFEAALREAGIDALLDASVAVLAAGPGLVALGVVCLALVLAAFFSASEVALLLVPLAAPLALQMGIDRLWLGVALALALHASARPALRQFSAPDRTEIASGVRLAFASLVVVAMFRWPELVHWLPERLLS